MKKTLFLVTLTWIGLSLQAQKIIENPDFGATTASYVKITKIELYDTVTKLDFEVHYFPGWWIRVSSDETCIQNSKGGEKHYVTRAEGIHLNEKHWTPKNGMNNYTLFFPPIDKNTETIDFMEESWKIFEINLSGEEKAAFIPEEIQGNWLKADGSNAWIYGIYDDKVIYNSMIWENVLLNNKGKNYELILKSDSKQEKIYIKLKKDGLLIGNTPEKMQLFHRNKTFDPGVDVADNEGYGLPVFNADTAIYKGYIHGYHPGMGSTGMAYVNDIIIHEQNSHLIKIEPDGRFYCEIPMIYPQPIYVRMLKISDNVYLEPGKTTFQYIDFSEFTAAYKNYNQRTKRERKSLFMGELSKVNSDLLAMDSIYYFDYKKAQDAILGMTGNEYKDYCLDIMDKELKSFERFIQNNQISKKALQIQRMEIPYRAYTNVLSFNYIKSSAYRKKHKVPREQREIPLETEAFEPEFYDFIKADDINNPISLVSGSAYNTLINRIRFSESVRPGPNYMYLAFKDTVSAKGLTLTRDEEELLNKLSKCESRTCIKDKISSDTTAWNSFQRNYSDLFGSIGKSAFHQMQSLNMEKYFGLSTGFATDIMFAQSKCEKMRSMQKPMSEADKKEINEKISNDFIVNYLMQYSNNKEKEMKKKLAANKAKTGYVINKTPKTEGDKLFDAIIAKYKGKVVFVDFWATWCGPCRRGMEKMKPLKEDLGDERIEFVYITNHSSPIDTWNMMIPDIKGEHYRVEKDEWNHFASKFNISGIPHYVLVDKEGNVVKNKIYFASSIEELKKMFNEYIEK